MKVLTQVRGARRRRHRDAGLESIVLDDELAATLNGRLAQQPSVASTE